MIPTCGIQLEQPPAEIVRETSETDDFVRTRAFYAQLGYNEEARMREYYDASDDKIVFRKAL
ncbi:MAG: hypothetical protein AB8B84_07965 [Granulosicoccus sp.]